MTHGSDVALGLPGVKAADRGLSDQVAGPRAGIRVRVAVPELDGDVVDEEAPAPSAADLHTDFLPFDRATLEAALDRFLDRLDGIGAELSELNPAIPLVSAVVVAGTTALASYVVIRRWRSGSGRTEPGEDGEGVDLLQFPGLLRLWCV
jgi:hypothetical protein